jgi:transposase
MDAPRLSRPGFSQADRRRLLRALARTHDAKLYRRLRAVAEVAEGEPVAAVARHARVARSTVHRWIDRYLAARALSALADGERSGRPRTAATLTDAGLRHLLANDPRQFGYNANIWTVPLLAAHLRARGLAISARTLRRRIRAARFRWKRPRYVYSERTTHVGAQKGGSSAASDIG